MLERRIRSARKERITPLELREIRDMENELCRRFLSGEMSLRDFRRETDALPRRGQLLMHATDELRLILKFIGVDDETIENNVRHELAHANIAQELGIQGQFGIQFVEINRQSDFRNVFFSLTIPEGFTDEAARAALRTIIEAPGEDMSTSDIAKLKDLDASL